MKFCPLTLGNQDLSEFFTGRSKKLFAVRKNSNQSSADFQISASIAPIGRGATLTDLNSYILSVSSLKCKWLI